MDEAAKQAPPAVSVALLTGRCGGAVGAHAKLGVQVRAGGLMHAVGVRPPAYGCLDVRILQARQSLFHGRSPRLHRRQSSVTPRRFPRPRCPNRWASTLAPRAPSTAESAAVRTRSISTSPGVPAAPSAQWMATCRVPSSKLVEISPALAPMSASYPSLAGYARAGVQRSMSQGDRRRLTRPSRELIAIASRYSSRLE